MVEMAPEHPGVPKSIVERLRLTCLDLPGATEETAWVGTRWMIANRNFAHVLMICGGWPPAYARAVKRNGPVCVLTFRAADAAARFSRSPFFRPPWFANIVGMLLDDVSDWADVAELMIASYRVVAPKKLVALLAQGRAR